MAYAILPDVHAGDTLDPTNWGQKVKTNFEAVKPRILTVHAGSVLTGGYAGDLNTQFSGIAATELGDMVQDGIAYFYVQIPSDYVSLQKFVMRGVGTSTGTLRWSANSEVWRVGTTGLVGSQSIAAANVAVTGSRPIELDLSALMTGVVADDMLGFRIIRYANGSFSAYYFMAVMLQYTP